MTSAAHTIARAGASGTTAALLSAAALVVLGLRNAGTAAGPFNGPTQLLLGEDSARDRTASAKTLLGAALHYFISIGWATVHEGFVAPHARGRGAGAQLFAGAVTSTTAYVTDYVIARGRWQPGFEKHLGFRSRLVVYAALAVGFALPALVRRPHR